MPAPMREQMSKRSDKRTIGGPKPRTLLLARRTDSRNGSSATVRTECLDWILIVGRRHLDAVLRIYVQHYNRERPHRGLVPQPP